MTFKKHISRLCSLTISPPRRLQDTTLALWIPCAALAGFEVGLSVWCVLVALTLRGLALCGNSYIKEQVCVRLNWCYYDLFISPF